jgi:NADPH-dependent 2,4-dienoyl-CoA reductase/sulfur reductase-like enzyme
LKSDLERFLMMGISREGWQWTPSSGLQAGLPSVGVIEPSQNLQHPNDTYDVVVIGAGYTGLTAARETSTNGSFLDYKHNTTSCCSS